MLIHRWPVDLPPLEVIEHVVGVFFERVPLIPKMLHKSTFKANLQLPPTHWKFPVCTFLYVSCQVLTSGPTATPQYPGNHSKSPSRRRSSDQTVFPNRDSLIQYPSSRTRLWNAKNPRSDFSTWGVSYCRSTRFHFFSIREISTMAQKKSNVFNVALSWSGREVFRVYTR